MAHRPASLRVLLFSGVVSLGTVAGAKAEVTVPDSIDKQMLADSECRDYDASHLENARETVRLSENHTLYLLPWFTGAYNVIYRVFVLDKRYPDEVRPSLFAGYSNESGWYGKNALINANFGPKTKTLHAFEKRRGHGDCGSVPVYSWKEWAWCMIEYRYWEKCDGTRQAEQWPVIFRNKSMSKR